MLGLLGRFCSLRLNESNHQVCMVGTNPINQHTTLLYNKEYSTYFHVTMFFKRIIFADAKSVKTFPCRIKYIKLKAQFYFNFIIQNAVSHIYIANAFFCALGPKYQTTQNSVIIRYCCVKKNSVIYFGENVGRIGNCALLNNKKLQGQLINSESK